MSAFIHALEGAVNPATMVAFVSGLVRIAREALLRRAASVALENGTEDQRREAGLTIVEALTRDKKPWYRQLLGRKSDDG